jgi:branched-chain amino acid transport system permease protein
MKLNVSLKRSLGYLIILILSLAFPIVIRDEYFLHIAIMTCIYSLFASSLNLIFLTGQVSIAHAAFYGIGAYTALLVKELGFNFWIAMPLSAINAMVFGLFVGYPSLRLKSHYFAICTFAFGELICLVTENWVGLTNGPTGIREIPYMDPISIPYLFTIEFKERINIYYLVLMTLVVVTFFLIRLIYSRVGRAFIAIREDDEFAKALGINIMKYKMIAFLIGTCVAGIAGSYHAHYIRFISPGSFSVMESINVLIALLLGGIGFVAGPIVGSIFSKLVPEILHIVPEYRMIIYGLIVILVIIYIPSGFVGLFYKIPWEKISQKLSFQTK